MGAVRGADGETNQVLASHVEDLLRLAAEGGELLVAEVEGGALSHDVKLVLQTLEDAVLALGQDPAIRLAVHSFGAEGSGHEEDAALTRQGGELALELEGLHLDEGVFLGPHSLAGGAIMVSARLIVEGGEDGVALVFDDLAAFPKGEELPLDEAVVVLVDVRGNEAAAPVHTAAHGLDIVHGTGREVVEPMGGVAEEGNVLLVNTTLLQNLPLRGARTLLGGGLGLLARKLGRVRFNLIHRSGGGSFGRLGDISLLNLKDGGAAVLFQLAVKLVGTSLDRHTRAMECLGEKNVLTAKTVVGRGKLKLGKRKGMTQMEKTIHIRVGKVTKILGAIILFNWGVSLKNFHVLPPLLDLRLNVTEKVTTRPVLFSSLN
mmetsp:Transcript_18784/g.34089  ORF Transcript_18784/g.34089 Transcript_18784/m.34089 type:complete len:375 (-) Transcript_18784:173-1297(-)